MGQKWCFLAIFVDTFWRRDHDFSVKKWYFVLHFWTTFGVPLFGGQIEGRIMVLFVKAWECILGVFGGIRKKGEKVVKKWVKNGVF